MTMSNKHSEKSKFKISGMHCAACEGAIERKFKALPGVSHVRVNRHQGTAEITAAPCPPLADLQATLEADGYEVAVWSADGAKSREPNGRHMETAAIFLLLMALYLILRQFNILHNLGISDTMGYGLVFVIGLVAAVSTCMAVSGGLLLAVAAKYNEQHPNFSR